MHKKTLIQIILFIFLIIFTIFIFKNFYKNDEIKSINNKDSKNIEKKEINKSDKNLIKNISYTANNNKGDIYLLQAEQGEIYLDNEDLMFLTNVKGRIKFKKGKDITINSDYANFNTKTFETTFINNVLINREDETITGDELYLVLEKDKKTANNLNQKDENLIRVSRNVFYKKPGYNLTADVLEVDLVTKNIKIFMFDKNKKVIASSEIK